ncbi:dTDP-4-dehydrorhamnose reductase [Cohnella panacarvi]|uniref:dTDP-4-dehydrorhamnose reductase n=1 Tax=Cohnella panacarvi TaxID=400776 RepID=UPI00047B2E9E|nr:dTDP-4-dehydrorhamnose reductase [Cohnella panacarvi]
MSDGPIRPLTIVVTGGDGQLGQELVRLCSKRCEVVGLNRSQLDVTDKYQCLLGIKRLQPDAIVHAAAYTAVDRAETDKDGAWRVNVEGTRNVAGAAEAVGASFCYISTDYVFDGEGTIPYGELDVPNPRSVYGKTKLEGERLASALCEKTFIVRTSWVYGKYGNNFVRTMLRLARQNTKLKVVNDQKGSPTYTHDLAKFIIELVQTKKYGVYHATNSGHCTWYEFAKAVFEEAGMEHIPIAPCTTEEYPRPAPRPKYSVLGNDNLIHAGFQPLRHWRAALRDYMSRDCGGD